MEDNTTRKWLYDSLTKKGYNLGSYDDYNSNADSDESRQWLYNSAKDAGLEVGTYEQFNNGMGAVSKPVQDFQPRQEVKDYALNNIPDMFKSKGNNLSTRPLQTQEDFSGDSSNLIQRLVTDENQRIEQAERVANDPYMRQQELEHVFKPKNQEQINNVKGLINAARMERAKERQKKAASVGDGRLFSTLSQAYVAGEMNDTDKQLDYAATLIEQAQNITDEAKKKGKTNFFSGFARGFRDAPLDGWAMGLQDLKNYSAAKKVMDKVDKGEKLNPAEDALMQALVTNAATQMYYAGDLGRGYKAGGVTAESLPFMLDMIAGMGTVQALTKPTSKALVKYATEKAAQYGLKRAGTGLAKGAARTVAGLGDVAAHTATFGSQRVAADYQRRGLGDIQVKPNEDGTVSYDGRENIQTGGEAIGKAIVSTAAETGSELLGEYFGPMLGWIGRATGANRIGKIIPASVGKAYSSLVNSQGFKQVQEIARRAKIADPIGEYGEEVVNNLVSTAIGDMTPEQLVDLDQNIDTFLGVAPMSALFGAAGTAGYLRGQYRNYRNMRQFENRMQEEMGEDWSGVREALQDADIETAREMVKDVLSSDMTPQMKKDAITYISSVLQEQTLQNVDKQSMPEDIAQAKRDIFTNLSNTRRQIPLSDEQLNEVISRVESQGKSALEEMGFTPEQQDMIMSYNDAYQDYNNYTFWVQDTARNARRQAEQQVESLTNATTGTVMRVKAGFSQEPVNILRGNVVFDAEGKVDREKSDNVVYYLDKDGKVQMSSIDAIESVIDDSPAEEVVEQAGNDAENEVLQSEEAQINPPIELGTVFRNNGQNLIVARKTPQGYEIAAVDDNGELIPEVGTQEVSEEDLRNAIAQSSTEGQITNNTETTPEQPVSTETQPESPAQGESSETSQEQEPQTALSRIPTNEKGEQDFESAPAEDTGAALMEISEGDIDDAKDTSDQMILSYQEQLKKADKMKTTGSSIQEIVRMKQEKKAAIRQINDKIRYWQSVSDAIEKKRPGGIIAEAKKVSDENQQRLASMTPKEQSEAQAKVQENIDKGLYERPSQKRAKTRYVKEDNELGQANTPMEHVLREIATGRVSFLWNDNGPTQGLGRHLGYSDSSTERKRLIWAFSNETGMTPEAASEAIHADMPENLQGMVTDQDIFNMIVQAFQEYGSPSKMWKAAKEMHGTDEIESMPGYRQDIERQALEWEAAENKMTVQEWIAYCDFIEEELDNMFSSVSDEELNTIFEQIYYYYERRNETESAGSTQGQTDSKQGDEVLPASESDNTGTGEESREQQERTAEADGEGSGVVSEQAGTEQERVNTEIEKARSEIDQNPTEAQKEAGNYRKGHVKIDGFNVTIENPKGSVRSGKDAAGNEWSVTMNNDYGYIRGTEGVDGDHIDVFLSDNPDAGDVFVIDQVNADGSFDEHKVMYGFKSALAAKRAYLANYSAGWKGLGNITRVTKEEFRKWIDSSNRKTKPFAEYNLEKIMKRLSDMGVTVSQKAKLENSEGVRYREEDSVQRSIVDRETNELAKEYLNEDLSRYPYEDRRTDKNNEGEVYYGYSEPLFKEENLMDSEFVPEVIKDIVRNNEYEIDPKDITDTLQKYIESEGGPEEEFARPFVDALEWFNENRKDIRMSDKVNLIIDRNDSRMRDGSGMENISADSTEDIKREVEKTAYKLNVPVEVITSTDQIKDESVRKAIESGRKIKGWYSLSDRKVYVYLPNTSSVEDARQTILHEGVAHFGLRKLVGDENMDSYLDEVFANVTKEVREKIISTLPRYGWSSRVATEEYLASMAEKGADATVWQRIRQAFKNLLRKLGIRIEINDNELRYILWRSRQNLESGNVLDMAKDIAMQYDMGVGNYYREESPSDGSREKYESSLKGWRYKATEAYQDSMLSLKNLQDIIAEVSGKPIKPFENAYMAENQLSSKNTAEAEKYYKNDFVPMLEEAGKMMKRYGLTQKFIERYMMLAHGIERNVEMSIREQANEIMKDSPDDAQQFVDDFRAQRDFLRQKYSGYEYLKELSELTEGIGDFSATQAILESMDGNEHADFQNDALEQVRQFEDMYDVKELWEKTNKATKDTLRKTYESGMMGRKQFDNVSDMFMYYVPLRGWSEDTAEDVYEYISSERNPVNSVLRSMKGRKSIPDEVFATIGNMAESAILQGNRNMMKQNFMSMVMNHPTDLATMRRTWYVYDNNTGEWHISTPEIEEKDTAAIIEKKISDHEERMKQLEEKGLATQTSSGLNIDYRIQPKSAKEHVVQVKNGGKDYTIYVNANPRAAQAINGMTNPDVEKNPIFKAISTANRWLAANFTTRNPAFVLSNLSRDLIFSMSAVYIKEDGKYSERYRKNLLKTPSAVFRNIRGKGNPNTNEIDRYFQEFIENGGETGYMHLNDVDKYKKKVRAELAKIDGSRGSAKAALDYTLERLEDFNRWAEDISRFTVYMTSRQMGKSIQESVNDAKEITVNFNKKGAGYKTSGFFGLTAGMMRNLYLFFNASVQSLTNFKRLAVRNKTKFFSILGGFSAAGMLMPIINSFLYNLWDGGDDDPYNDLPEWVRRNNLCIYGKDGYFLTIPLPIELRAFYGIGDMAYQFAIGKEKATPTNVVKSTVNQLAELLPLNPTGNEGLKTFMPDALAPIFEAYVWNEDFTGKPVAKITPFNERDPEWKRVYKGTSGWLVDTSKFLNDLSNGSGPGKEFRKGSLGFNPAKVEHLLESYFGGMAKTLNQAGKTIYYGSKSIIEGEADEDLTMRNTPILNRFINKIDDRNAFSGINREYFNLKDEMEQFKYELNGIKKNYRKNPEEYKEMVSSDDFRRYVKYRPYEKRLSRLNQIAKETEGEERERIEEMIIETRREAINAVK